MFDTWLVGILAYAPRLEYPIPHLGYIPLDIHTLPSAIASGAHDDSSTQRDHGEATSSCSKSVNATSSHHCYASLEPRSVGKERSISSPSMQRD